jgi:hypothetical protein
MAIIIARWDNGEKPASGQAGHDPRRWRHTSLRMLFGSTDKMMYAGERRMD